ncbi:MAG: alkaline phosphatase family protein, partial [Candidatus Acidiferrum sp.]
MRRVFAILLATVLLNPALIGAVPRNQNFGNTTTPIKHLVIIFQENVSFDHYFGSYPNAMNLKGENPFHADPNTPTVN